MLRSARDSSRLSHEREHVCLGLVAFDAIVVMLEDLVTGATEAYTDNWR